MLEPLAVDPNRSVAPAANSKASARLVFPAPAGPASAITRVPLDGCPAMRLSLRPFHGRASRSLKGARAPLGKPTPSACFTALARVLVTAPSRLVVERAPAGRGCWRMAVDSKGHLATSPWQMPLAAWKDIAARTYKRTWDDNVGIVAAGVAFYGFFALLSLLGLIVLAYGFVADPMTVIEHMRALTAVLPNDVAFIIGDQLMTAVKASQGTKGLGILVAFLVATYGGTNGSASVITALNIAYEEKEKRSLVRFYLLAVSMTLGALILALAALAGTAALTFLQHLLPKAAPLTVIAGKVVGYAILLFAAAGIASTLYRFGPSREDAQWRWITPGSCFAAIAWLLLTWLFG